MTMTYPVGGVDWALVQQTLQNFVVNVTSLTSQQVVWGQQDKLPRPPAPAIILRISNIAETGKTWVEYDPNPLTFSTVTVASINTTTNVVTTTAPHGLLTGDGPVNVASTGTLPSPLVALTNYWIIVLSPTTLQFASTYANTGGGQGSSNPITPIALATTGSGTITVVAIAASLRAGQEILAVVRGYLRVTLELHAYTSDGVGMNMATSLLQRVRTRRMLPGNEDLLHAANIGIIEVDRIRALMGIKDAVLFEPRATLDVHFCVVTEEGVGVTIIETVEIQDLNTGHTADYPLDDSDD